jgi:hypothetical protein
VLGLVGHRDGLVDQQDRHTILDAIRPSQSRVVQKLVSHQEKRAAVLRADEYREKLFVEHGRASAAGDDRHGAAGLLLFLSGQLLLRL